MKAINTEHDGRAQASAARALIDVTPTAVEAGFRFPTAVSSDLMAAIETIPPIYSQEDVQGRLRDVLSTACLSASKTKQGFSRIAFEIILHINGIEEQYHTLILAIGSGGNREPVITIAFYGEFYPKA